MIQHKPQPTNAAKIIARVYRSNYKIFKSPWNIILLT